MALKTSPLAPAGFPALPPIAGVRLAAGAVGVRYKGRTDLCVIELAPGTTVAGVYTRSLTPSAPVDWCRAAQKGGLARAIVINSGNANAFTGKLGTASVERVAAAAAKQFNCAATEILIASTGVIGEPLPDERIVGGLAGVVAGLAAERWGDAAKAIMTTDTYPKGATASAEIDGAPVTINAIAKGSGMIAPDMATMLCFVLTDAAIAAPALQKLIAAAVERSFNCITVDSDTSTSDSVIAAATGKAGNASIVDAGDVRLRGFRTALNNVLTDLAVQVVRDGEGAEKLIAIDVEGAASARAARRIGLAIANSPLVKTAIAGGDANWGRVVMAVGKSGEKVDRDKLAIWMGGCLVARNGQRVDEYDEAPVAAHFRGRNVHIKVGVGIGRGRARVWTCDLTHAYIDINADYRS